MKIETQHAKQFRPFNVTISVETLAELAALLSLTNQSTADVVAEFTYVFANSFEGVDAQEVREVAQGSLCSLWQVFDEARKEYNA